MPNNIIKLAGGGVIALLAFIIFLSTYFTVSQNEQGVVSNWGQFNYVAGPGLHFKIPLRDTVTYYRTDIQSVSPDKVINTFTEDNQEVDIIFTLLYRIPPDKVEYIYTSNRDFRENAFKLTIDRLKTAMGQVNTQVVANQRGKVRDAIKTTLTKDLKEYGVDVVDFQLSDMQFTPGYREAINKASLMKASVETKEYARQEAVKEAERVRAEAVGAADRAREAAKGQADAQITNAEANAKATVLNAKANADGRLLQATAEAKAIQLQGEATAAAITAQSEALKANATLVEMEKARRWNGALPTSIYAGAPIPFMNTPTK